MSRAPFGRVTFDSGGGMAGRVPVGFTGGIADDDVGLVHMQVQRPSDMILWGF